MYQLLDSKAVKIHHVTNTVVSTLQFIWSCSLDHSFKKF